MNAEQRGGMALNKDFRSKTGNGSESREGRAIATPTGESFTHIPPSPLFIYLYLFLPRSSFIFLFLCQIRSPLSPSCLPSSVASVVVSLLSAFLSSLCDCLFSGLDLYSAALLPQISEKGADAKGAPIT